MEQKRFDIEQRWPELFTELNEQQRRSVVQSCAASWHEGWEPNREDVADLVGVMSGAIDRDEYTRRSRAKAQRRAAEAAE